jgi:hypothetical protein
MVADRVEGFSLNGDDPSAPDGKRRTPLNRISNPDSVGGRTTPTDISPPEEGHWQTFWATAVAAPVSPFQ